MDEDEIDDAPKAPGKPGLDIQGVLVSIVRFLPLVVVGAGLGFVAVKPVSTLLSNQKKEAKAETILNFQPVGENARYVDAKTTVATLKDTIKIRENVQTAKERLGLDEPIEAIGKAIDAHVQKNTTLLVIETKWKTPRGAAELANTMRDIFLERYQGRVSLKQQSELSDLRKRLERVRGALKSNDALLQNFTSTNKIVDIEKESRALLEEFNNYGVLLEQAQAERKTVEEQARKLDQAINELKARVKKESTSMASLENLSDVNTRIERLRDTIQEDQESRKNVALLALRKRELERAKMLLEKGYISQSSYDKTLAEYETQRSVTEDTAQTQRWKEEREKLQKQIIPTINNPSTTPSAPILQTMLVRTFDIELQKIAVQKKVLSLAEARMRVKAHLDLMPGYQQQYDSLKRNIAGRETERQEIETRIAQKSRDAESSLKDFSIVSEASAPPDAGKNPLLAFLPLALPVAGGLVGLGLAVLLAFKIPRRLGKLSKDNGGLPILATIPVSGAPEYPQRLAALAQQLRQLASEPGSSVALVEDSSLQTGQLLRILVAIAISLGKRGHRVALIDGGRGEVPDDLVTQATIQPDGGKPTRFSFVSWFEGAPDLAQLRPHYDLILMLGPDAAELASYAVLVVSHGQTQSALLKTAQQAIPDHTEVLGLVLLGTPEKHLQQV